MVLEEDAGLSWRAKSCVTQAWELVTSLESGYQELAALWSIIELMDSQNAVQNLFQELLSQGGSTGCPACYVCCFCVTGFWWRALKLSSRQQFVCFPAAGLWVLAVYLD